jgi:rare lipoprotein A
VTTGSPFLSALAVLALLAGCASAPRQPEQQVWKPSTNKGGYYQDDGPGDNPPANLAAVPDAIAKDEPLARLANQPYEVLGNRYVPDISDKPYKAQGIASWYGRKFHGKRTSSGEPYDMYGMTAAHRTLPVPSYARVTNLKNGKSVVVRVNDRGPFHPERLIDLSYTAALKLGLLGTGSGIVQVERVFPGESSRLARNATPDINNLQPVGVPAAAPGITPDTGAAGLFLQLGAFGSQVSAEAFRDKVRQDLVWLNESIRIVPKDGLFRVRLGPYPTRVEARAIAEKIRSTLDFAPLMAVE